MAISSRIVVPAAVVASLAALMIGGGFFLLGGPSLQSAEPDTARAEEETTPGETQPDQRAAPASDPADVSPQPGAAPASEDQWPALDAPSILVIDETGPELEFRVSIPSVGLPPPVAARIEQQARDYLSTMSRSAAGAQTDASPWSVDIVWRAVAQNAGLISLLGESREDTGGPHANIQYDALIARTDTGEGIAFRDLFSPDKRPSPALAIGVCEALRREKLQRIGSATIFDEPLTCAGSAENLEFGSASITLAQSTLPGAFGGVVVHYAPYAVGAFAEGSYEVTIPQEVFAQDLKPEYRLMFAGEPIGAN